MSSQTMRVLSFWCLLHVSLAEVNIIDLTHTFGHQTIYSPGNPPYNFSEAFRINLPRPDVEAVSNYFQTAEHSGTHIDVPRHFCLQGKMVHEIPMDKLSGPGAVMDFRSQAAANYDYQITLQDVKDWEAEYGLVPNGAVVLFNFGWNQFWANMTLVYNTNETTNYSTFHFPGLGIEASRYLAGTRKVNAIGHDTPSTDYGQTTSFEVHINLLCDNDVIIIENVGNIDALPAVGTQIYIGAIKLENGSGTPVRLFAVQDDNGDVNAARETTLNNLCFILAMCSFLIHLERIMAVFI